MKIIAITIVQGIAWLCMLHFATAQSIKLYDPDTGIELDATDLPNRVQFKVVDLDPPASNPNCNRPPSWGYLWTFGDCSLPSTREEPTHLFNAEVGDYEVSLVLTPKYADEDEVLPEFLQIINVKGPFSTGETTGVDYQFQSGQSIDIAPVRACKPGDLNTFLLHFKNAENHSYNNPRIKFHYNAQYMEFDSNYVDSCSFTTYTHQITNGGSKGHLSFNLPSLAPQEEGFMAISLLTKTAAPMGISLEFKGTLFSNQNGGFVSEKILIMEVKNSHDPNEKLVRKLGNCAIDSLVYTINFENEGTAEADIVYVIDNIDRRLDIHSIALVHSSHDANIGPIIDSISLSDSFNPYFLPFDSFTKTLMLRDTVLRKLAFVHNDIHLEPNTLPTESVDGSMPTPGQGSVSYSIKPDANVLITDPGKFGTHAEIYFDDNPPISTKAPITNPMTCYCRPQQNNAQMQWIQRVKLGSIDHNSGNDGGYADFRPITTKMSIGGFYSVALHPGVMGNIPKTVYWRVFIDMDQNGIFDSYESVLSGSGMGPFMSNIAIPITASIGPTAMRIITSDTTISASCTQSVDGEMEDYAIALQSPMLPDLDIADQSLNLKTIPKGSDFTLSFTVRNLGIDSIRSPFVVSHYLSDDPHFDQNDYLLKNTVAPPLGQNAVFTRMDTLMMPMSISGTQYVITVADPVLLVNENDETNNEAFRSIVVKKRLPDVKVKRIRTCIKHLKPGDDLSLDFEIHNEGMRTAGEPSIPVKVKLYASNDPYFDPADVLLDSTSLDSIVAGSFLPQTITTTLPITLQGGNHFLLLFCDPDKQFAESDENNNFLAKKVKIASVAFSKIPYYTGFECKKLDHYWTVEDSISNRLEVSSKGSPNFGSFHLLFESPNSGDLNTAQFRANLTSNATQNHYVSFSWKDFDSTNSDTINGLYLSDNNGQQFHKIVDFNAPNGSWQFEYLSLDSLANAHSLNLGSEVIFEFKFRGASGLPNDGLTLDEFAIQHSSGSMSSRPFNEYLGNEHKVKKQIHLYPNPSLGTSTLEYHVATKGAVVDLKVYNLMGRLVAHPIVNERQQRGLRKQMIGPLLSGIYLCVLRNENEVHTLKLQVRD